MEQQALSSSNFDTQSFRSSLWEELQKGSARLLCKSCENAKVIYIQRGKEEPPWELWARIFQWLGPCNTGQKWRVFWFPASQKRLLPSPGEQVTAANINGGYSYPCFPDAIVIYRAEEATRVLIHEILHAACCDPEDAPLPWKEATTESWAELLLVAILSQGNEKEAQRLWSIQSQWIANQNATLQLRYNVHTPDDYAWRYTVGREAVLHTLKVDLPEPNSLRSRSLRLTSPELFS